VRATRESDGPDVFNIDDTGADEPLAAVAAELAGLFADPITPPWRRSDPARSPRGILGTDRTVLRLGRLTEDPAA